MKYEIKYKDVSGQILYQKCETLEEKERFKERLILDGAQVLRIFIVNSFF